MTARHSARTVKRTGVLLGIAISLFSSMSITSFAQESAETPSELNTFVMPRTGPFSPNLVAIPNARAISAWIRSGHADASGEAFSHWDEDGVIPPVCATCHSGPGFRSTLGLDGSDPGLPEAPVPTGSVVDCGTCHDPNLATVTEITLPSGVVHPVTVADAACTTCHQGRASGATVEKAISAKELDVQDSDLSFVNPHYALAAVTNLGGYGKGGYQYPDKTYSGRFLHAKPVATCLSCHDPHSLEVQGETCLMCHQTGNPLEIRVSRQSYDGSGDLSKGISSDIRTMSDQLKELIQVYAAEIIGKPIIYDGMHYPYFFADSNGDGVVDMRDGRAVAYDSWTPRLLRAAYNWKFVNADGGIYVHNPHYAMELIYDSSEDLANATGYDFASLNFLR